MTRRSFADLVSAVYGPIALLAALQIDLFSPLGSGPLTVEELADRLAIPPRRLQRLINLLLAEELLLMTADGKLTNGDEAARFFVKGSRSYRGGAHEAYAAAWSACLKTAESLTLNRPAAPLHFDADDPAKIAALLRGLAPQAISGAHDLKKQSDLTGRHHLLDIGGGAGGLSLTLLAEFPDLTATVAEIPAVAPVALELMQPHPQASRCALWSGDALTDPLPPHDIAVMRNFLQLFGPGDCRRALQNCFAALAPGGTLHIMGYCLTDGPDSPPLALGMDLLFLNYYEDGAAHPLEDYRQWLAESGFLQPDIIKLAGGQTLLTARKPA